MIYLADYGQTRLMPVPYEGMPARLPLGVDGTLAGRAYRTGGPVNSEGADEATHAGSGCRCRRAASGSACWRPPSPRPTRTR